ncbi:GumC family protein [Roseivivax sediminis]|uniref:non-specific protein-tyrosine kinase n=1 Tax=Roseivivax sediminis TaxID=936889 RepID=A0A1I2CUJ0_9RHOB|nr:polysaccharide biosynthesis tyrosine autokinase [Roseivivax sediminis]SFE71928.1 capsular exopolysaccharide family [Roseivivax sediminis]
MAAAQSDISGEDDVIDLGAILGTLWRGKLLIVLTMIAAVLLGGYYAYIVATPLFRSTATVVLETQQEQIVDFESVVGGMSADSTVINTEVEILRSRALMGQVVDELNLMDDPEFNMSLQPAGVVDWLTSSIKVLLGTAGADPVSGEATDNQQRNATISTLQKAVSVRNVPQTYVFEVTAETANSRKSARISNTLVELYISDQLDAKFEATESATAWLSDRVAELQTELETAEQEVKNFRADIELISPESLAALERQLKELRDRTTNLRAAQTEEQTRLEALRAAETPEEQAAAAGDRTLNSLLGQLDEPGRTETFEARFEQIEARADADVQRNARQIETLEASQENLETQIAQQNEDLITLQQLTREAEASRLLYEYFLSRLKETSVQQGIQKSDSRTLSEAVVPASASSPRKFLALGTSGMLGLLIGAALVLLLEVRRNTFRDATGTERVTGYPVMGQIPLFPAKERKKAVAYITEKPTSAAAEALRNLRTSLLLSNVDKPPQVVLVSSSIPGEGKTTLAMTLAKNFTGMDKRVLLIEGDIRRRTFEQYIDARKSGSLVSVISGETGIEDAIVHDEATGLEVLMAEKSPVNAADLFSSQRFADFLVEARKHYDHIIIDTPPVLVVPDARVIAQVTDAVLFVIRWDHTSRAQVNEALQMFESVNHPVTGVVLNQISAQGMKRYGYGGKYGAYSSYGKKYYTD